MAGYEICQPASIAYSGTSASIVGKGSVTFDAVTSLSLNSVFTSSYVNYEMLIYLTTSGTSTDIWGLMRSSGTDESTASNYASQYYAGAPAGAGGSTIFTGVWLQQSYANYRSAAVVHLYAPNLAKRTIVRSTSIADQSAIEGKVGLFASYHALATSYDGFTIYPSTGTMTGRVVVYGGNN